MKLTPNDLIKPSNVSGFRQVGHVVGPSRGTSAGYFQAYENGGRAGDWKGPARGTALKAAYDYCERVNTGQAAPPKRLARAAAARVARDPIEDNEVKAAYGVIRDHNAQLRGRQGFVYLISDGEYVKVGYSVKPEARVGELQTGNARELRLLASMPGTVEDERALHLRFLDDNLLLEWFRPSPALLSEFGLAWRAGASLFG